MTTKGFLVNIYKMPILFQKYETQNLTTPTQFLLPNSSHGTSITLGYIWTDWPQVSKYLLKLGINFFNRYYEQEVSIW